MMNGIEKKQLQIDRGTRPIIECLDEARMHFGFDKITVQTPIVETRLRSGLIPARPLKFSYISSNPAFELEFTIPNGYPNLPLSFSPIGKDRCADQFLNECHTFSIDSSSNLTVREIVENISEIATRILSESNNSQDIDCFPSEVVESGEFKGVQDDDDGVEEESLEFYCCRICRYCLADSTLLHDHSKQRKEECTSLFVEDAPIFLQIGEEDSGKILCPKCSARVGHWGWVGNPCSCGEWIAPGFQFTKSKIDAKKSV